MKTLLLAAMATTALTTAGAAFAQGAAADDSKDSAGLEEIVVTAQKRAENVQDVPIAVAAVTGDQLATSGVTSTLQINVAVPGVNIRSTVGSFQPSIRGVGTSSNNVENPVALYIDGVYFPFQREGLRDLSDIAQIAVLKGPQGTLFGRNATGGVLQITTRAPSHDLHAELGSSIDNYATWNSNAYVTGGLSDSIAASLSGSYATQGKGWGKNITTGHDSYKIHANWSLRSKVLIEPGPDTKITLIADYQDKDEDNGPYYQAYPGTTLRFAGANSSGNVRSSTANIDSTLTLKSGGASGQLVHDFGFAQLTSITAARRAKASAQWDVDGTSTPAQSNFNINQTRMLSQEVQLVSAADRDFHWSTGAFYIRYRNGFEPFIRTMGAALAATPAAIRTNTIVDRERTTSFAPFAQVDFTVLPDTRLTLGGRWSYEKRVFTAQQTTVANNGTTVTGAALRSEATKKEPTWRVSLDHKFSDDVMGYLSYNRGFKSGGYNIAATTLSSYDPEILDAYELGLKTELFDRRARFNVSGFYYDYKDLQLSKFVNGAMTLTNAAAAEIYGIDADFEARLSSAFRINGGFAIMHSKYKDYPGASFVVPNPAGGIMTDPNPPRDAAGNPNAAGNRLQNAQEFSASITATYTVQAAFGQLDFSVTESHNGDYYFEADNFARQPAYDMVNASIAWTSTSKNLTLTAFLRNALDEKVIGQAGSVGTVGLTTAYTYAPRTYGASFKLRF